MLEKLHAAWQCVGQCAAALFYGGEVLGGCGGIGRGAAAINRGSVFHGLYAAGSGSSVIEFFVDAECFCRGQNGDVIYPSGNDYRGKRKAGKSADAGGCIRIANELEPRRIES